MGLRPFVRIVGLSGAFAMWAMAVRGQETSAAAKPEPCQKPPCAVVSMPPLDSPPDKEQAPAKKPGPLDEITLEVKDALPRKIKAVRNATPGDLKIDAALDRIVTLTCEKAQLKHLVEKLNQATKVPVELAPESAANKPLDPETFVSIKVYDVPLAMALDELKSKGVGYRTQHGKLVLYLADDGGDDRKETRIYSISLLKSLRVDEIVNAVQSQTSGPWGPPQPGAGTIHTLGDTLVVRHNLQNHREVEGVLNLFLDADISRLVPEREAPRLVPATVAPPK